MKIGVFDSGRGGEFIANGLSALLPDNDYVVIDDRDHVPYGSRTDPEVIALTGTAIQPLLNAGCPIIVIACNTATMASIEYLRATYKSTLFVGIEPMIKPAATLSKSRHITVLGTPLTMASSRYSHLKATHASGLRIDEPDASGWAAHIEHDNADHISFEALSQSVADGSDVIVLACTHYITLKDKLESLYPDVTVLEPTEAIARQISLLRDVHGL